MQDFRQLQIWKEAHQLVMEIYPLLEHFPGKEKHNLISQIQRAATSIPINLAEGCGRGSDQDFGRFVQIAIGSARELEYLLLLAYELHYLTQPTHQHLSETLSMLQRRMGALRKKLRQPQKFFVSPPNHQSPRKFYASEGPVLKLRATSH